MADANRSGDPPPQEDDDPDRTQRIPDMQAVVDQWFPDDEPTTDDEQSAGDT